MKNKLSNWIGSMALTVFGIFIAATATGTIIYWIYPIVIPGVFPFLIKGAYMPATLPWWTAVCFSWFLGILRSTKDVVIPKSEPKPKENILNRKF